MFNLYRYSEFFFNVWFCPYRFEYISVKSIITIEWTLNVKAISAPLSQSIRHVCMWKCQYLYVFGRHFDIWHFEATSKAIVLSFRIYFSKWKVFFWWFCIKMTKYCFNCKKRNPKIKCTRCDREFHERKCASLDRSSTNKLFICSACRADYTFYK